MIISSVINEWNNAQLTVDLNRTQCLNLLHWSKPPVGIYKLNTDGSRNGHSGKNGVGGVIRCSNSLWIKGFQVNLGIGEFLDAETWGLFYGLKQALNCHITHIDVETDSAILVKLVLENDVSLHPLSSLISCCKALMRSFQNIPLKHVYRENNMVTDCLAKQSLNHDYGIIEYENPPALLLILKTLMVFLGTEELLLGCVLVDQLVFFAFFGSFDPFVTKKKDFF